MARTVGFDRERVIRAARTVFWSSGYESASVPDLEAATGLSRSSLYNSFGSKRGLFEAAVESYLDEVIRPRLAPLTADVVHPAAIVDYLEGLRAALDDTGSMSATSGCLLINAAGAPIANDPEVARVIADYRRELQDAMTRGVLAAHAGMATPKDIRRLAESTTGMVIAALALARIDPAHARVTVDTALELVTAPMAGSTPAGVNA
ncbi:AcrR family transcriptional regulator [Microbacterium resistens]|uniref:AcrR family transcriptional regulator n=1 Tax=Microbacterium resistens TaxID=156977 RepID=A0ABU1SGV3_9MICO|nr:TetR/AcrR family transcriptional regulator [Microbacterium resistens]MDR6868774.1 AcrR family transcriptional regulator [Microbacterium resistens]